MTKLLEQAISAVYQLPEKDQDAIASLILEKIATEGIGIAPSPISQADIETLEQLYSLRDKSEVLQFLEKYSFLVPALLEAPDKIRHHFPDEQLFLQVVPDPEIIDYVHLVLSILTERNPDDALSRLQKFDEDWLQPFPYTIKEHLITIAEFRDDA